jgi:uncharacterized protein (TIGR00730 family)
VGRVCVFAGSKPGRYPEYADAAAELGDAIARRGWGLVYGGTRTGLMGALSDAALAAGGEVLGVIPGAAQGISRERAHDGLTNLYVVGSMHERKAKMHDLSDAFVALPGGFGTLDEMFEAITWMQLGIHGKPLGFLDVRGYWQPLARWIERSVEDAFVEDAHALRLVFQSDVARLLGALGVLAANAR